MTALLNFISGKKTYVLAVLAGLDMTGAQLGWWPQDSLRGGLENILMFITLRAGVTKSGPTV